MGKKRIMCLIYAVILLVAPMKVSAYELSQTTNNMQEEETDIKILTSAEAERLYYELTSNDGIQLYSDLGLCEICISKSDGRLLVVYSTSCRGVASKIGVRNMTLQQKKGLKWKDLVIRSEYSENTDAYFGGFIVEKPEVGEKYRVKGTHYVVKDSVETSRYAETDTYTMPAN
ncbi:MAG: hypothetical protein K2M91_15585 [Lachnospiraceae bacterium]|nr:hypothetical protein [Lachnospiraceae bacterium]